MAECVYCRHAVVSRFFMMKNGDLAHEQCAEEQVEKPGFIKKKQPVVVRRSERPGKRR